GPYTATLCDDLRNAHQTLRDNPTLNNPADLERVFESVRVQTGVRRSNLVLRLPVPDSGVALNGKPLPHLPSSMVQLLGNGRRTGAQLLSDALVSRRPTDWVIQGSESVRITVVRHKKTSEE